MKNEKKNMVDLLSLKPAIYGLQGHRANHYTTRNNTIYVWWNYNRFYLHKGWFCPWVVVNVSFLAGRNRVKEWTFWIPRDAQKQHHVKPLVNSPGSDILGKLEISFLPFCDNRSLEQQNHLAVYQTIWYSHL